MDGSVAGVDCWVDSCDGYSTHAPCTFHHTIYGFCSYTTISGSGPTPYIAARALGESARAAGYRAPRWWEFWRAGELPLRMAVAHYEHIYPGLENAVSTASAARAA